MTPAREAQPLFDEVAAPDSRLRYERKLPKLDSVQTGDLIICPDTWGAYDFIEAATALGAHVRTSTYRWESSRLGRQRSRPFLTTNVYLSSSTAKNTQRGDQLFSADAIDAYRASFKITWDALSTPVTSSPTYTQASTVLPNGWQDYLPFPTLNPAQTQAAPALLGDKPLMVVAPTGAGKTQIGMIAALTAIKKHGKKAAWLVPQRSLTAELDRELDTWRSKDISVIALSGEARSDREATRNADLWVATTEKFEALCRSSSMKEAIEQIGVIVVDEIHLLGDPTRGPVLENLLARIRATGDVRLVGLSATVANAEEIADWLGAELLTVAWRPTRQTNQIVSLPPMTSTRAENEARNEAVVEIVDKITRHGGPTLVFCGTKKNVRSTAVAVAKSRGVDVDGVDINDEDSVRSVCDQARVGLHYSDWGAKKDAEAAFRDRRIDVLVATSTLAAGVNTPARAVIVRDTSIGAHQAMEISMVQQMFGRAGRAGRETEGWAFLLAPLHETALWRMKIAAGYTVNSGIAESVEEHLLGEITQGNIVTQDDAERWWERTLAYHQGARDQSPLQRARDFLVKWKFVTVNGQGADARYEATPMGQMTSRMMVGVRDAAALLTSVSGLNAPTNAGAAESEIIRFVAESVEALNSGGGLSQAEGQAVKRVLESNGVEMPGMPERFHDRAEAPLVSAAGMLLATRAAASFRGNPRMVRGISRSALMPALYDSPRHFAWLAGAARIGAVDAWVGPVAHDLGRRIEWFTFAPPRGAGRLLWACEYAARSRMDDARKLFIEARNNGCLSPEQWAMNAGQLMDTSMSAIDAARVHVDFTGDLVSHTGVNTTVISSDPAVAVSNGGDIVGGGWLQVYRQVQLDA